MAGLAAGAVALPASAHAAPATGTGPASGPRHEVTYFYGSAPQNMLDAYWHTGKRSQPGILILHGGYWVAGDKGAWQRAARWFADRGYAVFSANYRLAQQAPWPAQRHDALDAITYIKRHAAQFHLDPGRLAVLGSSAGGQIATDIGTHGSAAERIRGVVALSPVVAPYQAYLDGAATGASKRRERLRRTAARLAGCRPGPASSCWSTWYSMTPKNHVGAGDVPMYIAYSQDDLVSPTEGMGLRDALRAHGLMARLSVLPGAYHGGALLRVPGVYDRILGFFDRVTKAKPAKRKPTAPATVPSDVPSGTATSRPSPSDRPTTGSPRPTLPTRPPTPTPTTPVAPTLHVPGD